MPPIQDLPFLSALTGPALMPLLDLAVKGTVILGAALLLAQALRGASAGARHLVWGLSFAGLLAMPVLLPVVPRWEVGLFPALPSLTTTRELMTTTAPELVTPPAPDSVLLPATEGWMTWVVLVWFAGFLTVLLYFWLGSLRLWALARKSRPVTDGDLLEAASWARRKLHLRRRVRVRRSAETAVPMTWGVLRPLVLLPATAKRWDAGLRRDVLLHELAHVKRSDYLIQLFVRGACAAYWFHPLVWLAARELRHERERACDDQVLRAGSAPSEYAEHLLQIASSLRRGTIAIRASVAMARSSGFFGRVSALLDADRPHGSLSRWAAVPGCVTAGLVMVPLAAVTPWATASPDERGAGESPLRVVHASFASGDIVRRFDVAPRVRVPETIGIRQAASSRSRDWCPIRFAEPVGERE